MENNLQKETRTNFEFASLISLACIVAMVVAVISCGQDLGLRFRKEYLDWILKIPEWVVMLLDCVCWCTIFLCIGNYCKKTFNFKSSLFAVLVGLEIAIFLLNFIDEDDLSFVFIGLFFLVAIAYCVIMLIVGIQINKTKIQRQIPIAFIVYSIAYLMFILLLPAIIIDAAIDGSEKAPAWVIVGSLIAELIPLYLINKVFGKISKREDLEKTRKEIFNNNKK
jgi:hypothetical protein